MAFPVGENALIKESSSTYVPGTIGVPASDGKPYIAPYAVDGVTDYTIKRVPRKARFVPVYTVPPLNQDQQRLHDEGHTIFLDLGGIFVWLAPSGATTYVFGGGVFIEPTWVEVPGP
jgi:hypothetical protein